MVRKQPSRIIMKPVREITNLTWSERGKIFIKENFAPLGVGLGILVILFLCGILWLHSLETSDEQASYLLFKGSRNLEAAIFKYKAGHDQELLDVIDKLQYLQTDYSNTNAGILSYLYLGHAYVAKGDYEQAVNNYKNFLLFGSQDRYLQTLANQRIAFCYEEQQNYEESVRYNRKIVPENFNPDKTAPPLGDFSLYAIGRSYELMGESGSAFSAYTQLKDLYPASQLKNQTLARISLLTPPKEEEDELETGADAPKPPATPIAPPRSAPMKKE